MFGSCINLLIETLYLEKILVILERTPGLSITSNLRYAEKTLSAILLDLSFFLSEYSNSKSVNALKFLQLFTYVGLFIVPPFLFVYFTSFQLQLKQKINRQSVLLAIAIMLIANPFVAYLMQWNQTLVLPDFLEAVQMWLEASEQKSMQITEAFLAMNSMGDLLITIPAV